jgi:hypothetical protein
VGHRERPEEDGAVPSGKRIRLEMVDALEFVGEEGLLLRAGECQFL